MKTAIYIEDGTVQLVLTPENDFEKSTIKMLGEGDVKAKMFQGSFYDCRGGWVRQSDYRGSMFSPYVLSDDGDWSLILRVPGGGEKVK